VPGSVFAISDLHSSHPADRMIIDDLCPECGDDWLIVAGDVDETFGDIEKALRLLRQRYAKVIWTPGNHELWTLREDPVQLRGEAPLSRPRPDVPGERHPHTRGRVRDLAGPDQSHHDRAALPALRPLLARARHEDEEGVLGIRVPHGRGLRRRNVAAP
jgi:hypothetical protein